MSKITVTFEKESDDDDFLIEVTGVGEHLYEVVEGDLTDMDEQDKEEFNQFILGSVTPKNAVREARNIVYEAPGFDHIPYGKLGDQDVTATVSFEGIELNT